MGYLCHDTNAKIDNMSHWFHFKEILRQCVNKNLVMWCHWLIILDHNPFFIWTCYYKLLQTLMPESLELPTRSLCGEKLSSFLWLASPLLLPALYWSVAILRPEWKRSSEKRKSNKRWKMGIIVRIFNFSQNLLHLGSCSFETGLH